MFPVLSICPLLLSECFLLFSKCSLFFCRNVPCLCLDVPCFCLNVPCLCLIGRAAGATLVDYEFTIPEFHADGPSPINYFFRIDLSSLASASEVVMGEVNTEQTQNTLYGGWFFQTSCFDLFRLRFDRDSIGCVFGVKEVCFWLDCDLNLSGLVAFDSVGCVLRARELQIIS